MSKKKGMSFDTKKEKLLEYMQEHKSVYTLKELESSASKSKGIVSQSIKEVLTHLVSDGLVDSDKIGAGALPSKQKIMAETRVEQAKSALVAAQRKHQELTAQLAEAQAARPTSTNRTNDLKRLQQLKSQTAELTAEVGKFADSDPDRLKRLNEGTQVCVTAANRWTDNLQTLISTIREQKPEMSEQAIMEHFSLPKNMDYIEA